MELTLGLESSVISTNCQRALTPNKVGLPPNVAQRINQTVANKQVNSRKINVYIIHIRRLPSVREIRK